MASLLVAATLLSYTAIKEQSHKRKARRAHQSTAFSALEQENAARIAHLQSTTCFCQRSDWRGGGCDVHGYVPPAGEGGEPPVYTEVVGGVEDVGGRGLKAEGRGMVPEFQDGNAPYAAVSVVPGSDMQGRDTENGYRRGGEEMVDLGDGRRLMWEGDEGRVMKAGGLQKFRRRLRRGGGVVEGVKGEGAGVVS